MIQFIALFCTNERKKCIASTDGKAAPTKELDPASGGQAKSAAGSKHLATIQPQQTVDAA
jgi:hypothetical protein